MPQKRDKWFITGKIGSQSSVQSHGQANGQANGHENPAPPVTASPVQALPPQPTPAPSPETSPPIGSDNKPGNLGNQGAGSTSAIARFDRQTAN